MSYSFLLSARARNLQARFGVANGLEASSNTTNVRPHEFLDHMGGPAKLWQPCTPAMAAGLTDHVWTLHEVLMFRVPPWSQLHAV
jgi:hypothetical protein